MTTRRLRHDDPSVKALGTQVSTHLRKMGRGATLLEVRGVKKVYATLTALGGVDLTVTERSFHGLIGPNGSGKTTLLKCIAGAETATAGTVTFLSQDITGATPSERSRQGMSLKFQITSILPSLSVYDNVLLALQAQDTMAALMFSRTRAALHGRVMAMLAQFRLDGRRDELAGSLSHGQQQWLEISMALAREPRLLLLDEPTAGMSPQERHATGDLLAPIRERCSLLIVEHDLDFIKDICDTLTVLDQGLVVDSGPTQTVQNSDKVQEAYLAHA
jgi:branched-chain amino acid transport system ATP-binding protein